MHDLLFPLQSTFQRADLVGVQCGRSFFTQPSGRPYDLGDNYELWGGIFQSTVLGSVPYVNVDVAHKAFPSPIKIIDLIKDLGRDQNLNGPLDNMVSSKMRAHLKGLQIRYVLPGNEGSVMVRKFLDLDASAANCRFNHEGTEVTVQSYYNTKYRYRIQYPNLPCIKVGSEIRSFSLPAELCSVQAGQVSLFLFELLML